MSMIIILLLIAALVCFLLAAFGPVTRISCTPLGLAFATVAYLAQSGLGG